MGLHRIRWLWCLTNSLAEQFVPRGSCVRLAKEMSHHTKHAVLYVSQIAAQSNFYPPATSRLYISVFMDDSTLNKIIVAHKSSIFPFLFPAVLEGPTKQRLVHAGL